MCNERAHTGLSNGSSRVEHSEVDASLGRAGAASDGSVA